MKSVFALVALAAAAIQPALAHYRFNKYIDTTGTVTGEYVYVRANTNINSPLTDVASTDIRCNAGGLTSGSKTSTTTVPAGSTVGFQADIPLSHPGPMLVYLGKVPSGQTAATSGCGAGNPSKVSIPGVYSATDPAILINIYWPPVTSYTPPGPAVWSG
ncbi:hypothetical protein RSAG8_05471, partial [Rhizoctonia solani AG-8 WAC10335]